MLALTTIFTSSSTGRHVGYHCCFEMKALIGSMHGLIMHPVFRGGIYRDRQLTTNFEL